MAKNTANYGNDSIRQLKDEERVRLRPAVIFGSDGLDGCAHAAFEILSNAVDTANYGNDSIRQLKDEERVRLRPAVIFGSDGLDGCAHAAFEILSNAVDEARQGYGKLITLTAFRDGSIQVEDNGRGCPLDWNPSEKRFNWELVFCELYAGGKYNNNEGGDYDFSLGTNGLGSCATQYASEYMGDYDFSLGTNGLGSCATQYASEYMDVTVWRDGNKYSLHFKKGKVVGAKKKALEIEPSDEDRTGTTIKWRPDLEVFTSISIPHEWYRETMRRQAVVNANVTFRLRIVGAKKKALEIEPSDEDRTGTTIKWRPDLEVFTSISIPHEWYRETMRRQAVVNANVTFRLRIEGDDGELTEEDFCYPKGIEDYVLEKVGADYLTEPFFIEADRRGRDREDLPDYNVKITARRRQEEGARDRTLRRGPHRHHHQVAPGPGGLHLDQHPPRVVPRDHAPSGRGQRQRDLPPAHRGRRRRAHRRGLLLPQGHRGLRAREGRCRLPDRALLHRGRSPRPRP